MKSSAFMLLFCGLLLTSCAGLHKTAPQHSAVTPAPREDPGGQARTALIDERVRQEGSKAKVAFIGDSITEAWEGMGRPVWERDMAPFGAINMGVSGDRTQNVLERLGRSELNGLHPQAVVLLIGTNNAGYNTAPEIAEGVLAVVKLLRQRLPEAKIIVMAIYPRRDCPPEVYAKVDQANRMIHRRLPWRNVEWLDINDRLLPPGGTLSREIMPDLLHLSQQGYEIWSAALKPELAKIVK